MVQATQVLIPLMCLSTYYVPDAEEQVVSKRIRCVYCLKGRQILDQFLTACMNGHTHGTEVLARSAQGAVICIVLSEKVWQRAETYQMERATEITHRVRKGKAVVRCHCRNQWTGIEGTLFSGCPLKATQYNSVPCSRVLSTPKDLRSVLSRLLETVPSFHLQETQKAILHAVV